MKEKIEKLLKSNLKRKVSITTATLIAFLLSSNITQTATYEVGSTSIKNNGTDVTENLSKLGLFKIGSTGIENNLKDSSNFKLLSELNKNFTNNGSIYKLTNESTKEIINKGVIKEITSRTTSNINNLGYISESLDIDGNLSNSLYIWMIQKAENINNSGYIQYIENNTNIKNYGYAYISSGSITNTNNVTNYGILGFGILADYNSLNSASKLTNQGIIVNDLTNFSANGGADDNGREILNYKLDSNPSTLLASIDNKIINNYRMNIEKDIEVKNNSIFNMNWAQILANKKLKFNNSTVNIGSTYYNNGVEIKLGNNSNVSILELKPVSATDKVSKLTMDNTTAVGFINIPNIDKIELVKNSANPESTLKLNNFMTEAKNPTETIVSTNVDLLGRADLGKIRVKGGGRLTIAKDALKYNGLDQDYSSGTLVEKLYKKDISVEGTGRIIIGIDPYDIGSTIELGKANNLTDTVIGQKDTTDLSQRLGQEELNIDADSLLHDIVILPAYSVNFEGIGPQLVRNKLKVIETTELPKPPTTPSLDYNIGNTGIKRNNSDVTEYLTKTGLFKIGSTDVENNLKDKSDFKLLSELNKNFINNGSIDLLRNESMSEIINKGYIRKITSRTTSDVNNLGNIYNSLDIDGNLSNSLYIWMIQKAENINNSGYIGSIGDNTNIKNYGYAYIRDGSITNTDDVKNYGILDFGKVEDYNSLKGTSRLINKGIIESDLTNFNANGGTDDNGRDILNYKLDSNPSTLPASIDNKIINNYEMNIEKDIEVKNNSIFNMNRAQILANKKLKFNNSTINIRGTSYNNGVEIKLGNNSNVSILELEPVSATNRINKLTMDNTTAVGSINIPNIDKIELVKNSTNPDSALKLNLLLTEAKNPTVTIVSTNVDLIKYAQLGDITVKEGGKLTIASQALFYNGLDQDYSSGTLVEKLYKKDISIEGNGKIIIGIDPYNIGSTIYLGKANNLTDTVVGQNDPAKLRQSTLSNDRTLSQKLTESKVNIDADSLLHDIVILPAYSVNFEGIGPQLVRNKLKVIEELGLPTPPTPPGGGTPTPPGGGTPTPPGGGTTPSTPTTPADYAKLNEVYKSIGSSGNIKHFTVPNTVEGAYSLYSYLRDIYANSPYAITNEIAFKNLSMFRDNASPDLKPNLNKWAVMGGLSYNTRENKYKLSTTEVDTKTTGAYAKGEYGLSENGTLGLMLGGTNTKANMTTGEIKGSSMYLGVYGKKYINNFKFTLGTGVEFADNKVEREAIGYSGIIANKKYSAKQKSRAFDLYAEARYSVNLGNNLYIEPNFNLAYSRAKQKGLSENDEILSMDIKSKTFNQTSAELGVDLRKEIVSSNTKHSLALGTSYERVLSGAKETAIRGNIKGGSEFDITVPAKEKGRLSVGAEYKLENVTGIMFNVKVDYGFKHNSDKKDIRVSTGIGYRF